jgi:hypothetical protein
MNVSANGEQKLTVPFKRLTNLPQFVQIREWLEKVVKEDNIECCARIAVDGQRDLIFHYEILYQSYVGSACMNGNSVKYDASSNPSIGLFYIFDFNTETIPVYTIGYTIDFVRALYYALFDMCCKNGNGTDNFITEWYFYENYDYFKWSAKYGMWNFYHDISSSIIDSYNGSYFRHK